MSVSWIRHSVAGLSPLRLTFETRPVIMGLVVAGTGFSPSGTIFPFHYLSAIASYSYFIHPVLTLYDASSC